MAIIKRVTMDMFEFADVCSYMVNPVNLQAAPGAGLALEFRRRVPDDLFFTKYRDACRDSSLRIGTIQVLKETSHSWGLINLPTKRMYNNHSDKDDIARGLEALREFLKKDENKYCSIGMPMLGCGLGAQDYEVVYPMMVQYLGDLDATVFLSMSPERTEERPKYLVIAGPSDYGTTDEHKEVIDTTIDKVMAAWGMKLEDYEGIVSGGYAGVDKYICGEEFQKNEEDTYVFRKTGKIPIVVKPNTSDGLGANLHLGNLLCEIGDDIILFKPNGHNNNRLSAMQTWLQADKENRHRLGMFPKRVAIFGEKAPVTKSESVLIPVTASDVPY
jgi:O-acetyl-ADP-ribose deacetylase (regulator of RNase III)